MKATDKNSRIRAGSRSGSVIQQTDPRIRTRIRKYLHILFGDRKIQQNDTGKGHRRFYYSLYEKCPAKIAILFVSADNRCLWALRIVVCERSACRSVLWSTWLNCGSRRRFPSWKLTRYLYTRKWHNVGTGTCSNRFKLFYGIDKYPFFSKINCVLPDFPKFLKCSLSFMFISNIHCYPSDVFRSFITQGVAHRIVVDIELTFWIWIRMFPFLFLEKLLILVFFLICLERLRTFYGCPELNPDPHWECVLRSYLEPGLFYVIYVLHEFQGPTLPMVTGIVVCRCQCQCMLWVVPTGGGGVRGRSKGMSHRGRSGGEE